VALGLADSNSPTWLNNLDGQVNLYDAVRRKIAFTAPNGKEYKLNEKTATLIVRYAVTLARMCDPSTG
jgi:malate synthase